MASLPIDLQEGDNHNRVHVGGTGMPLAVTDVEWTQNDVTVFLTVPLRGAHKKNVDIFSTDAYIKVAPLIILRSKNFPSWANGRTRMVCGIWSSSMCLGASLARNEVQGKSLEARMCW